ncbi:hypothetical protein FHU33_1764 [Blastococcus colisei]|uniref:ApeA N-terminal domain-containing protein n=1 Tax=Blastococcus colisei TaxID=1564162 RepID=A0A543PE54_9ACTN|nr:hypothetical protein [Blastococcus colisei]TQN42365.1 hypothetical protein FHU33_1764 [Blastococcus colisei]
MEDISFSGSWWLPENPDRKLAGRLVYDAADSLQLVLYDNLREIAVSETGVYEGELKLQAEPIVHGIRHDDRNFVTLVGVRGSNLEMPAVYVTSVFDVDLALLGSSHVSEDAFERVDVEFDYLKAWAQPPTRVVRDPNAPDLHQIRTAISELASCDVGDGSAVALYTGVVGVFGDNATDLIEYCAFQMTVPEARQGLDLVNQVVRPLQDLLMVSLGREVRLTEVRLSHQEGEHRMVLEALFPVAQPPASIPPLKPSQLLNNVLDYRAPTLLTAKKLANEPTPLPTGEMLADWFREHDGLGEPLIQLLSPFYAPFMSPEHRYSATFQSAEALHDVLALGTKDLPKAEHRERVSRVVELIKASSLPEADADWAQKVLSGRNDKSLSAKIESLLEEAGPAGAALLAAAPSFGTESAKLRARVSHGGARVETERWRRTLYEHALRWIIRGHLICRLLDSDQRSQLWEGLAGRESFKQIVQLLSEAVAEDQ